MRHTHQVSKGYQRVGLQGSKANDRHARCKHRLAAAFLLRVPAKARLLVFFVVFQEHCYHVN